MFGSQRINCRSSSLIISYGQGAFFERQSQNGWSDTNRSDGLLCCMKILDERGNLGIYLCISSFGASDDGYSKCTMHEGKCCLQVNSSAPSSKRVPGRDSISLTEGRLPAQVKFKPRT